MTEREPVTSARPPTPATPKTPAAGAVRNQKRDEVRGLNYEEGQKALSPAAGAPKPVDELGSALVLSRDAGIVKETSVSWFADLVAAKATAWGLAFDRKSVRWPRPTARTSPTAPRWWSSGRSPSESTT